MMTPEQIESIKALKDEKNCIDDNIRYKEIIKSVLKNDARIIHVLNNPDLNEEAPDDYIGINIKSQILIPEINYQTKNFICFKTDIDECVDGNNIMYNGFVTFVVFCDEKNIDTEFGISRHDLLGYLIKDNFKWGNSLGKQAKLVQDEESVTDTHYNCRTLVFEITSTNGIYKDKNVVFNNNKKYIKYGVGNV